MNRPFMKLNILITWFVIMYPCEEKNPTSDSNMDVIIVISSRVNRGTRVDPLIIVRDFWDVQVRLSAGCVSEWLAIFALVIPLAISAKGYDTRSGLQLYIPANKHHLTPCLSAACQVNFTPQVETNMSDLWKKKERIVALILHIIVKWLYWLL